MPDDLVARLESIAPWPVWAAGAAILGLLLLLLVVRSVRRRRRARPRLEHHAATGFDVEERLKPYLGREVESFPASWGHVPDWSSGKHAPRRTPDPARTDTSGTSAEG